MPHFFLPIDWVLTPTIIILSLFISMSLIYWATPKLKFPQAMNVPLFYPSTWTHISESYAL